ncbi:MAG: type I 3-dehydroquinate dehydratase [Clostridia bacterium]|nr:type I 3-dehydroquinate dehydratase [Clostridia bacterium]
MMKQSFFENEKALLTVMVQGDNPDRIKELIDKSVFEGAEAFGMQFEQMNPEYRTKEVYCDLFSYAKEKPVYVTNYRFAKNEGKSDEQLAEELLELADCGANLCDVMGDYFDRQPDEVAIDMCAIKKQMELIDKLHKKGAKVLMSSHVLKFIPAERVLDIALEHQRRGADICKIVTGADTMEQQLENLKIINMLKENLTIPFLFLCGGECNILRRIGGELGCCMYLCVHEYDKLATPSQPLLKKLKNIRDNMS